MAGMKILVYGWRGWIGNQFTDILDKSPDLEYHRGTSRVDDDDAVIAELEQLKPTHVVSLIGRTHGKIGDKVYSTIDYLEQPGKLVENTRDNLFAPMLLALESRKRKIHFTYLGTGCIFKFDDQHPLGDENTGFTEDDKPNFFGSSYSVVKGFTDRLMHEFQDCVLNLRIRMPITGNHHPRNFITKIAKYEYICSMPNSMTVLPDMLPRIVTLMRRGVVGSLNFTNPGLISHNDILEIYRDLVDPNFKWKNFSQEEQLKILAADRSNNCLATGKLVELCPDVPDIRSAVRTSLESYAEHMATQYHKVDGVFMNLLVTGGCGFIGSHFINHYMSKYKLVSLVNIDAMYYCANEENVAPDVRANPAYTFYKGNVADTELVTTILKRHKITHVIHFAAQSHVQKSFYESLQYTHDNIMGTHTLLEACRLYGEIRRFVHVSTDEVYGESLLDDGEVKKTEESVVCPSNPYAATKAGAELIAEAYLRSFRMPIIITRGNNVYGPGQYEEKVIPRFIKQLQADEQVTIEGDGSAVRGFLHVRDTSTAFEAVLLRGKFGEIYNIGCEDHMEISIAKVAKILIEKIKKTQDYSKWISYVDDRPFNDKRYYITNKKLKELGWEITTSFADGIGDCIQ